MGRPWGRHMGAVQCLACVMTRQPWSPCGGPGQPWGRLRKAEGCQSSGCPGPILGRGKGPGLRSWPGLLGCRTVELPGCQPAGGHGGTCWGHGGTCRDRGEPCWDRGGPCWDSGGPCWDTAGTDRAGGPHFFQVFVFCDPPHHTLELFLYLVEILQFGVYFSTNMFLVICGGCVDICFY